MAKDNGNNNNNGNKKPVDGASVSTSTSNYGDKAAVANQANLLLTGAGALLVGSVLHDPMCALVGRLQAGGKWLARKIYKGEGGVEAKVIETKDIHSFIYDEYPNLKLGERRNMLKNMLFKAGLPEEEAKAEALRIIPKPEGN